MFLSTALVNAMNTKDNAKSIALSGELAGKAVEVRMNDDGSIIASRICPENKEVSFHMLKANGREQGWMMLKSLSRSPGPASICYFERLQRLKEENSLPQNCVVIFERERGILRRALVNFAAEKKS